MCHLIAVTARQFTEPPQTYFGLYWENADLDITTNMDTNMCYDNYSMSL